MCLSINYFSKINLNHLTILVVLIKRKMIFEIFSLKIQVNEHSISIFYMYILDIWIGMPGTLEQFDYLARDYFDASSNNDVKGQKTLIEKAQEETKKLVDKKDQKKLDMIKEILFNLVSILFQCKILFNNHGSYC